MSDQSTLDSQHHTLELTLPVIRSTGTSGGGGQDEAAGAADTASGLSLLELGSHLQELVGSAKAREGWLDAALAVSAGERAFLLRFDSESEDWTVLAARSFEGEEILNPREKIIEPLVSPCRERGAGYYSPDLESEGVFEQLCRSRQPRVRSLLILPFSDPDMMLYVDHRFQSLEIDETRTLQLGCVLSAAIAVEQNALQIQEREQLESELREARRQLKERRRETSVTESVGDITATPAAKDSRGLRGNFTDIIGQSPQVVEILQLLDRVAPTNAPVLINGESGTGKELIAGAIHLNSPRRDAPIVSENCGALTETLLESELFGYVKGAFTGAYEDREGLFEVAHGGTLFLDEIGDTSAAMQKKLLRVLQEGTIRRVGGSETITVDVRIVSATNKDLMQEVQAGRFREDLFYRLNVINVVLPPLRDRREDIPLLAEHFVHLLNQEADHPKSLGSDVLSVVTAHEWPGNIRELQNEMRRMFTLSEDRLDPEMLSPRVLDPSPGATSNALLSLETVLQRGSLKDATEELERQILAASLRRFNGNKALICSELQIPKTTLYTKLKRYGLSSED